MAHRHARHPARHFWEASAPFLQVEGGCAAGLATETTLLELQAIIVDIDIGIIGVFNGYRLVGDEAVGRGEGCIGSAIVVGRGAEYPYRVLRASLRV